jgi:hypothetical protein
MEGSLSREVKSINVCIVLKQDFRTLNATSFCCSKGLLTGDVTYEGELPHQHLTN